MLCTIQDGADPGLVTVDETGRTIKSLGIGEQILQIGDTVGGAGSAIVAGVGMRKLLTGVRHIVLERLAHGHLAGASHLDDSVEIGVGQVLVSLLLAVLQLAILFESILFHRIILLFGMFNTTGCQSLCNQCLHGDFLLLVHSRNDLFDGLVIVMFESFGSILLFGKIRMLYICAIPNDGFVNRILAMGKNRNTNIGTIDRRAGICSSKNETHFTDLSVKNIAAFLGQMIGAYRKLIDIAVLNSDLTDFRLARAIKETVHVHAVVSSLKEGFTENVFGVILRVLEDKRNICTVLFFKSILANCTAVRAQQLIPSGITTKIRLHSFCHFEWIPPFRQTHLAIQRRSWPD